ncbi:MAG: hypothetical protein D6814_08530 [Calditrichaeota bacterium]|nr:MAG: hypothetical protein D6814_08530 [Calditrichota bacterium]
MLAAPGFAEHREVIKKTFQVKPGGKLFIDSALGSINVSPGVADRVEVEVRATVKGASEKRAKEILQDLELQFKQTDNEIEITTAKQHRGWNFWQNIGRRLRLHYEIRVPEKFDLDLTTAGGSIQVDGVEGEVEARTSGGSLKFGRIIGPVTGKTSGGSIELEEGRGNVQFTTSGGSIRLGRIDGDIIARTSGGSITIEQARGTVQANTSGGSIKVNEVHAAIQARTSGGTITAYITEQPQEDCRLTTSGGSIHIYMKPDIALNLDAKTSGGSVKTDFPVTVLGTLRRNRLEGKINGGGPELYLRTSGGSIYLHKL